jgi:glutathione S-transferase
MSLLLYGAILSPYVRKVLAFAAEKDIEVALTPGGMGQGGEAFAEASPFAKMPALRHVGAAADGGDYCLADSTAICHYLDAAFPAVPLIPTDPRARGEVVWLDEFSDTILGITGGKMFFNRVVLPKFMQREGDLALADTAERDELPKILDWLNGRLTGRDFLVGDALTLADISVAAPFANIAGAGVTIDAARHPELARWLTAITARPAIARMNAKVEATLARVLGG